MYLCHITALDLCYSYQEEQLYVFQMITAADHEFESFRNFSKVILKSIFWY